jgi:2-polyprenyl-3-methyl-5-hydroxy-6-metoxy-1,4-benzoquinol methylase
VTDVAKFGERAELSFLAPPDEACDWRMVVAFDAAANLGLIDSLQQTPATPDDLAASLGLDEHAVRVVLEELSVWQVVRSLDDGRFTPGKAWPQAPATASLHHHARAIRSWSTSIEDRLRGVAPSEPRRLPTPLPLWLDALGARARRAAPAVVGACLAHHRVQRVLELGGGHGEYGLELARQGVEVVMQDRPEVIDAVRGSLEPAGIRLFAGDFFEVLPEGPFDLVLCAGVTHTFDRDRNQTLCRRAATVTASGGSLAILTYLRGRDAMAPIFAMQMLMNGSGADTHAERDYRHWLIEAGYRQLEIVASAHPRESLLLARR